MLNPDADLAATDPNSRLPDFAGFNITSDSDFAQVHGHQLGDPVKDAQIMHDGFTSSGTAVGRNLPAFLTPGSDASAEISKAANQILAAVDDLRATGLPEAK